MSTYRFASTASLVALATMIAGCATPNRQVVRTSGFGGQANGEIGLATRALAALNANDFVTAIGFAERAVEKTPADAGFRALLGNAYFGAGRFVSAEAAYKDALAIYDNQPQVVLKLVLVEIAQGKNADAIALLDSARGVLDPADFGLALTLAGRAADAIPVLEASARVPNADARVRQNLALSYAFAGDWERARIVASQDVPAGQLDARIQQWMRLANPAKASDQVAALVGVTPAAADPGQPVRLALRKPDSRQASAAPALFPAPQPQVAETVVPPPPPVAQSDPAPQFADAAPAPAAVAPAPPPVNPARVPAQVESATAPVGVAQAAAMAPDAPSAFAAFAPKAVAPAPKRAKLNRGSVTTKLPPVRNAALRKGNSTAVVQLGAYGSRQRVSAAWDMMTKRYPALRAYTPLTARFEGPKGTVYRLSIKGFAGQQEAMARCKLLKGRGGSCFVRNVAGDAPIQIASR